MPSLLTRQCRLIVSKQCYLRKVRRIHINDSLNKASSKNNSQKMHVISSSSNSSRHEGDDNSVDEAAGNCSENDVVREEDSFQVDLRVHGVSHDAINKDEERMSKIQTSMDKLQDGYRTKSIINDLEKKSFSNTFSEASRRTIKEMGNIE